MVRQSKAKPRPRPLDHGDPRTPMAWQHRNLNYQYQTAYSDHYGGSTEEFRVNSTESPSEHYHPSGVDPYMRDVGVTKEMHYHQVAPRVQPSTDISSSSSSTDESHHMALQPQATWDGEPCPVHHGLGMLAPLPVPMAMPLPPPPPPPILLPPAHRPRQMVLPAPSPAPLLPLPVREHIPVASGLPQKTVTKKRCAGQLIVFWTVLAVIVVGVILALVLRFVMV